MTQTLAVTLDTSMGTLLTQWGVPLSPEWQSHSLVKLSLSQVAPILPYLLLVLMLVFRPRGLLGSREG